MRTIFFILALGIIIGTASESFATDEQAELTFRQDGDDLVVTVNLTVNNSPHVVLTESAISQPGNKVRLPCCIIQNRDILVRSRKQIEVQWRISGRQKGDQSYWVDTCMVTAGTGELQRAIQGMQELVRAGQEIERIPAARVTSETSPVTAP